MPNFGFCTGSGTISLSDVNYYFGRGTDLNSYRGTRWAARYGSGPGEWGKGYFSSGTISLYEFYNKGPYIDYFSGYADFQDLGGDVTIGFYNSLGLFNSFNHTFGVGPWRATELYLGKGGTASSLTFSTLNPSNPFDYYFNPVPYEIRVKIEGVFDVSGVVASSVVFVDHIWYLPPTGGVVTGPRLVEIWISDA